MPPIATNIIITHNKRNQYLSTTTTPPSPLDKEKPHKISPHPPIQHPRPLRSHPGPIRPHGSISPRAKHPHAPRFVRGPAQSNQRADIRT